MDQNDGSKEIWVLVHLDRFSKYLKYRTSANNFRGNHSFLNLTLCTVTFDHSTYRCGNYSREETIRGNTVVVLLKISKFQCNFWKSKIFKIRLTLTSPCPQAHMRTCMLHLYYVRQGYSVYKYICSAYSNEIDTDWKYATKNVQRIGARLVFIGCWFHF